MASAAKDNMISTSYDGWAGVETQKVGPPNTDGPLPSQVGKVPGPEWGPTIHNSEDLLRPAQD